MGLPPGGLYVGCSARMSPVRQRALFSLAKSYPIWASTSAMLVFFGTAHLPITPETMIRGHCPRKRNTSPMTKWRALLSERRGRGICERTGHKPCRQTGCVRFLRQKCRPCVSTESSVLPSIRSQVCRGTMSPTPVGSAWRCPTSPALLVKIHSSLPDYSGTLTGMTLTTSMGRAVGFIRDGWATVCWRKTSCRELCLVRVPGFSRSCLFIPLGASARTRAEVAAESCKLPILRRLGLALLPADAVRDGQRFRGRLSAFVARTLRAQTDPGG